MSILVGKHNTNNTYTTGTGQLLTRVHEVDDSCENGCVIHDPSEHPMASFLTHYRTDRQIMERICPHGIGHPDPDSIAFAVKKNGVDFAALELIHGCDGCCAGAYTRFHEIKNA
jgi:hypothetical protein